LAMAWHAIRLSAFQAHFMANIVVIMETVRSITSLVFPLTLLYLFDNNAHVLLYGIGTSYFITVCIGQPWKPFAPRLLHNWRSRKRCLIIVTMWKFGWPMSLWLTAMAAVPAIDRLLLQHFVGYEAVGIYASVFDIIVRSYSLLLFPVTMALHPRIMATWHARQQERAYGLIGYGLLLQVLLFLAIAIVYWFCGATMLSYILRADNNPAFAAIIMPLTVGGFFWQAGLLAHKPLEMHKRTKRMVANIGVAIVLHCCLQAWLLSEFGLLAAPYAYLVSGGCYLLLSGISILQFKPVLSSKTRGNMLSFIALILLCMPQPSLAEAGHVALEADIPLGPAYASSSINVSVFRQSAVLSTPWGQFTGYYDENGQVRIVRIDEERNAQLYTLVEPRIEDRLLGDGHCSINIGFSMDGYLHVMYGAHATHAFYAKILLHEKNPIKPVIARDFGISLTYPQFYNTVDATFLLYRSGKVIYRMTYDNSRSCWLTVNPQEILVAESGITSVYIDRLGIHGNRLVLTWVYRIAPPVAGQILNKGLYLMLSNDGGDQWEDIYGNPISLPVRLAQAPLVFNIGVERARMNQCSAAFDHNGSIYVADMRKDEHGIPQIYLLQIIPKNGSVVERKISINADSFDLFGSGTLVLPLSRPEVAISEQFIHVIYRQNDRLIIATTKVAGFTDSPVERYSPSTLHNLNAWEPNYDIERWRQMGQLVIYWQAGVTQGEKDTARKADPTIAALLTFREQ
jgi:hypothetical protein